MALMIWGTVTPSLARRSGFTQQRKAYWPPKTWTRPTPGTRVSGSIRLMNA
jgi:hypothetical protein